MNDTNSPKTKILLAEDDASMRRFIEITLQRDGYEVVSAEDGLAAMKILVLMSFMRAPCGQRWMQSSEF